MDLRVNSFLDSSQSLQKQKTYKSIYLSPLRYPGGKRKLASFIASVCRVNNINGHYVEPYAGGAAVGLELLFTGQVKDITINDLDRSVYAFWKSVLTNPEEFCSRIQETKINTENRNAAREIQRQKKYARILDLGFSTFFLNRTNYSGILNAGMLGGKSQTSQYGIDARFNKQDLIERIMKISKQKKHIHVHNSDAMDLVARLSEKLDAQSTLYYFDPPYYSKGAYLYMNHYGRTDHQNIAERIQNIGRLRWIVSYDDVPDIKNYYSRRRSQTYSLSHTARSARLGDEILFFSDNLDRLDEIIMEIPNRHMSKSTG